jgi:hypothetical protein
MSKYEFSEDLSVEALLPASPEAASAMYTAMEDLQPFAEQCTTTAQNTFEDFGRLCVTVAEVINSEGVDYRMSIGDMDNHVWTYHHPGDISKDRLDHITALWPLVNQQAAVLSGHEKKWLQEAWHTMVSNEDDLAFTAPDLIQQAPFGYTRKEDELRIVNLTLDSGTTLVYDYETGEGYIPGEKHIPAHLQLVVPEEAGKTRYTYLRRPDGSEILREDNRDPEQIDIWSDDMLTFAETPRIADRLREFNEAKVRHFTGALLAAQLEFSL